MNESNVNSTDVRGHAGDLSFSYPWEIQDIFDRIKVWVEHPDAEESTVIGVMLTRLSEQAERVLTESGYPTDLSDLLSIDSNSMKTEAASAKHILLSSLLLEQSIGDEISEEIAMESMKLMSAVFHLGFNPFEASRNIEKMLPDHETLEKQRKRLSDNRSDKQAEAKQRYREWLALAVKQHQKNPSLSIRSIASNVCKQSSHHSSHQTIYKFLLNHKKFLQK